MSEELKPCPFCGNDAPREGKISGAVWCEDCHSVGNDRYRWNTRPVEAALAAKVKELEAENKRLKDTEAGWADFLKEKLGTTSVVYFAARWREMEQDIERLRAELKQARKYVSALVEKMTAEDFCALVEAGEVDGIRAWMEDEG